MAERVVTSQGVMMIGVIFEAEFVLRITEREG